MSLPRSNDSSRRDQATTIAGLRLPFDKRWALLIAAALVLIAVAGGVYLGLGAGQGSPVKQDAASDAASAGAPDLGASAQMEMITGKSALGGSSAVMPTEPGAIVAPGGVELQRQDPAPEAAPPAEPMASAPLDGASDAQGAAEHQADAASAVPADVQDAAPVAAPAEPASN
ncbi:MAG: hypothetical protein WAS90_12685 [Brachymonas denitrificans]|jgi:hypothetical protein|uniref:hypothetical protein n=1 Tax=Brachymonas denitrificans TaxID=28220 RepID=UPI003220951C